MGAGTGVSPLRGFVQERDSQRKEGILVGPTLLFYGCRHPAADFLYHSEFEAALKARTLSGFYPAFSRADDGTKTYVQHRIVEQAETIWAMIEDGASVYVCGDARRMAPDVQRAFVDVFRRVGQMAAADAEKYLVKLKQQNARYCEDIWAVT